ncbi:hypothetical protein M413DRAFT_443317 [Hebeloma cylindrosporum]|uniref:EamA domain-containing protein n=1 Tax=Hebeloma cylindrosporum TaxID=76867 RepID=A0A0C2YTH4_HEBCY|nr:hypothetical protein M413DRAFT_443317 [Hebeloma cylindrosporum h7]
MSSMNGYATAPVESTGIPYSRDVPNAGERDPLLAQNTGKDIEKLSRVQVSLKVAREVAERNTGLLLIVASEAFFAVMEAAAKILQKVEPPVTTFQLMIIRMIITYIGCIIYMFIAKIPDPFIGPKGVRILLLLRGIGGSVGLFGIYYSLQYLSLSDATVLTFFAPTCTAIAGAIFLGESFKLREAMAGFVSLAGVVLIARPAALFGGHGAVGIPSDADKVATSDRMKAVVVSLIGVLGATLAYTSIRAIGRRAHPMHAMVSFSTICILMASIGMIATKTKPIIPTRIEWLSLLAMIGIFGFLAQILLTMGLQRETASRGTLAIYSKIIFATIVERIVFHTLPTYLSVVGTLMIVFSALYIVLTKEKTKTTNQPVRLPVSDEEALEQDLAPSSSRN